MSQSGMKPKMATIRVTVEYQTAEYPGIVAAEKTGARVSMEDDLIKLGAKRVRFKAERIK